MNRWKFVRENLISFTLEREQENRAIHIDVAPETERLVREEISSGYFSSRG